MRSYDSAEECAQLYSHLADFSIRHGRTDYRSYEIKTFVLGVSCSGVTSIPNFMEVRPSISRHSMHAGDGVATTSSLKAASAHLYEIHGNTLIDS
jgi:hypothetical protein